AASEGAGDAADFAGAAVRGGAVGGAEPAGPGQLPDGATSPFCLVRRKCPNWTGAVSGPPEVRFERIGRVGRGSRCAHRGDLGAGTARRLRRDVERATPSSSTGLSSPGSLGRARCYFFRVLVVTSDLPGAAADLSGARRLQTRKHHAVGWPVAGLIVLGICGLAMVGVTTSKVGALPALVGAAVALLPVGLVFAAIVWLDRWEPEPPLLLLGALRWGVGGATACALLLNDAVTGISDFLLGGTSQQFFSRAVMAPLVEEAAKALFVVALWFRRRSEFNGLVDGIVYAALTAAGFAFTENILYFGKAFAEGGLGGVSGGVVAVFLLRGVLAPFSHPLFSAMIGIGIGLAARTRDNRLRVLYPVAGYFSAVLLHG